YVDDFQDRVPRSYDPYGLAWVQGWLDFNPGNPSNWNIDQDITKSLLWPYCGKNPGIWKCPADRSKVKPASGPYAGQIVPRVRSISMNAWFDSTDVAGFGPPGFRIYKRMSAVIDPGPALTWVF